MKNFTNRLKLEIHDLLLEGYMLQPEVCKLVYQIETKSAMPFVISNALCKAIVRFRLLLHLTTGNHLAKLQNSVEWIQRFCNELQNRKKHFTIVLWCQDPNSNSCCSFYYQQPFTIPYSPKRYRRWHNSRNKRCQYRVSVYFVYISPIKYYKTKL